MGIARFDGEGNKNPPDALDKIQQARSYLTLELLSGPRRAAEVAGKARAYAIKESTLAAARKQLGIKSQRRDNVWYWLPPIDLDKKQS